MWLDVEVTPMETWKCWRRAASAALVITALGAADSAAQGWIEPGVNRGGFAVDRVRSEVVVRVQGRVAQVEVSEWFVNAGTRLAEGEYLYPLAGEAVFQGFSLFQGETELRGEIMDADRARTIYEAIVRRRADPALIELAGQGLVRARVFPIQPGETRKVSLRYTQVLERAGNALQLAYAGGVPAAQRGAGDVLRHTPQGIETSFRVIVDECEGFLDPFSPTHALDVQRTGSRMTVRIEEEVSGRLAMFFPLAGEAVGLSVATHRPVGEDGYFMLTLSPDRVTGEVQPRDVTVVMDVSGSMSGEKIEQGRAALHQLLGTLSREDRFRLLSFSSGVQSYDREWTAARGGGLDRARGWVDRLVADGGTNIEAALEEAFRLESPRDRLPVVVFLTDGLPSVGTESPDELARIAERHAGRARVFAFGVGHDVNTQLLDRLGEAGRGDTDYVQPGENVERALSLLAAKIQHPVLTDLRLEGGPVEIDEIYPVRIPDVFAGEELVLFGRFSGDGQSQVTVRGERQGDDLDFSTEVLFPKDSDANEYIPRLWASRKLGHLERQVWTEGMTEDLAEEIRSVALRYGLPSRFTAYLVQEPEVVVNGRTPVDPSLGGATGPRGGSGKGGVVRHSAGSSVASPPPTTGADAVSAATSARRMRSMTSMQELTAAEDELMNDVISRSRATLPRDAVGGRQFELRDEIWTDVSHRSEARLVEVRIYSSAWFALLEALPELEAVLRKHESVVIAGAGLSVQVGAEGTEVFEDHELARLADDFRQGRAG
jgi:Ca-activated chloride channel family protein